MGKRGRPKKNKDPNLDENTPPGESEKPVPIPMSNYYGKRNVMSSLGERIRERYDPDLICDSYEIVCMGYVPMWVRDARAKHGFRVIPDPNPMLPTTTYEQRMAAMREMANRGWGQPPQSFEITAQLKQTLELGIPAQLLEQANYKALAIIRDALRLEDGNTEDAEWTPIQEPCQTETPADSPQNEELKESCQAESSDTLNENSAPGDDPSAL